MVGFLTFDTTLHFYNLKAALAQPQMLVRGLAAPALSPCSCDCLACRPHQPSPPVDFQQEIPSCTLLLQHCAWLLTL